MAKKNKKEVIQEPQYGMSLTNMVTYNYKVYYMSKKEQILYFLLAFVVGAAVGYLFYGGIGKDEFGDPTTLTWILNVVISCTVGCIAGRLYVPIRRNQIIDKQKKKLNLQFRDFLDAFNTSLGAGKNVVDSFYAVNQDLKVQYDENAFIMKELSIILSGIANNVDIELLLADFGVRSGNDDIISFANVFSICYRKGGNIKDTIRNTHQILSEKLAIKDEIETVVSGSKNEQSIMIVMPILLIGMIKVMSPEFAANFETPAGIAATSIGVVMFIISYYVGKSILNIKI